MHMQKLTDQKRKRKKVNKMVIKKSKPIRRPSGPKASAMTFDAVLEDYNRKVYKKSRNMPAQPSGLADALDKAPEGYSDRPRVKLDRVKGK